MLYRSPGTLSRLQAEQLRNCGLISSRGKRLFFEVSGMVLGPTLPLIQQVPGALSLELKLLENTADHSPPSGAKFKNHWRYNSILPLPSYMDNFINLFICNVVSTAEISIKIYE